MGMGAELREGTAMRRGGGRGSVGPLNGLFFMMLLKVS